MLNMGTVDRALRLIVVGAVALAWLSGLIWVTLTIVLAVLALVAAVTGGSAFVHCIGSSASRLRANVE